MHACFFYFSTQLQLFYWLQQIFVQITNTTFIKGPRHGWRERLSRCSRAREARPWNIRLTWEAELAWFVHKRAIASCTNHDKPLTQVEAIVRCPAFKYYSLLMHFLNSRHSSPLILQAKPGKSTALSPIGTA
jgi:hypothetical protein